MNVSEKAVEYHLTQSLKMLRWHLTYFIFPVLVILRELLSKLVYMFKNYLLTAWRNFRKNRLMALINLGGLSVGITAVLLIGMYIYSETGYDSFHQHRASLYRVGYKFWQSGKLLGEGAHFTPPFAVDAKNEFPEIQAFTRISSERVAHITYKDKTIKAEDLHHADASFFQVFSYRLLKGDPSTALRDPYSIILTSSLARKLFGAEENAVGRVVRLNSQTDYLVTGVSEDPPSASHLNYNALLSFITLYKEPENRMGWDGGEQYVAYLQLKKNANAAALEKKLPAFMWEHINSQYAQAGIRIDASLQPIQDIHLYYSDNSTSLRTGMYVFFIVALLILIISCVNYINLTSAQALNRYREIGVRKVFGAGRGQLVQQFLAEAVLYTIIAFLTAVCLVIVLTPAYQQLIGKALPPFTLKALPVVLLLFVLVMLVGLIAGSYVAFYLSSFPVTRIFKALLPQNAQSKFRKGLIIAQFAISCALMACTLIVSLQLRYNRNTDLGFDKDRVLVLPLTGENTRKSYSLLQQKLSQLSSVQQVTALSEIPYFGITNNGFVPDGDTKTMIIHQLDADEHFLKTFRIDMVAGDFFSKDRPSASDGYVINETLAKTLGWKEPLGKTISRDGRHTVIGVIRDFHFASLHDKIEPLIITNKPWRDQYDYLAIKYQSKDVFGLVDRIKQTWKATLPGAAFDYWFLDEGFNNIYKSEERFRRIFLYFSVISILLSLAGVFALMALALKQRTRELGIRKVLGADLSDIIRITAKDFVRLVIAGALIATPPTWYYMDRWLQIFAYRIDIGPWIFAACGGSMLIVTVLLIGLQAVKANSQHPVKSLRSE